jgi:hypothetical protein
MTHTPTNDLVLAKEQKDIARSLGSEEPDFEGEAAESGEYWKYYKKAKGVFAIVPGFKLEISTAIAGGYRWLKVLKEPENGLRSMSPSTRYLSPKLSMNDYEAIQDFCLDHSDDDFKFFAYMLPVICLGEADNRSKLPRAIAQELALGTQAKAQIKVLHATDVSETNPEEVVSFIPELPQFPSTLRNSSLTFWDFLQWFHAPPEQELFALHVGRAGTGPQGATLAGEGSPLDHSYRKAMIVRGMPQVGKSYVNEWLIKGFEFCGLKTAPIQSLSTNFGHGEWLASAWAYADDTNKAMLNAFYTSAVLKTACSNGLVKSEKKGADSYDIKAMCAPIMLANDTDSRDSAKADSGMGDRLSVLITKTMTTAKGHVWPRGHVLERCKGTMPAEVITFLCRTLEVSPEVLSAFFIRLCVDHFRSFTWEELQDRVTKLSHKLYAQTNCTNLQLLANACVFSKMATLKDASEAKEWQHKMAMAGNSTEFILDSIVHFATLKCGGLSSGTYYNLRCALFTDYKERNQPVDHPYRGFLTYSVNSTMHLGEDAVRILGEVGSKKGPDRLSAPDVMAKTFKNLVDAQGVSSQYSLATIHEKWREALTIHFESLKAITKNCQRMAKDADSASVTAFLQCRNHFGAVSGHLMTEEEELNEQASFGELTAKGPEISFILD